MFNVRTVGSAATQVEHGGAVHPLSIWSHSTFPSIIWINCPTDLLWRENPWKGQTYLFFLKLCKAVWAVDQCRGNIFLSSFNNLHVIFCLTGFIVVASRCPSVFQVQPVASCSRAHCKQPSLSVDVPYSQLKLTLSRCTWSWSQLGFALEFRGNMCEVVWINGADNFLDIWSP